MFGSIGMTELIVIMVVALIVIGPKRLPEMARSLGKALGDFRRATSDFQDSMNLEDDYDLDLGGEDEKKKAGGGEEAAAPENAEVADAATPAEGAERAGDSAGRASDPAGRAGDSAQEDESRT